MAIRCAANRICRLPFKQEINYFMMFLHDGFTRKLSILNQITWAHHRSGWEFVLSNLYYKLHIDNGIEFIGYLDGYFQRENVIINNDWIGVLHNPPHLPVEMHKRHSNLHSISTFLNSKNWYENRHNCRGLIVLSSYCEKYIINNSDINVLKLYHPTEENDVKFNVEHFLANNRVLSVGHWLRNFNYFDDLRHNNKVLIKPFIGLSVNGINTKIIEHLNNDEYDSYMSSSVVFLNLYDSSANNIIVECIERNTPLVINRLPAVEEYLGRDYPLFYDNIKEANHLINSNDLLVNASNYISKLNKDKYNINTFIKELTDSKLYKEL